VPYALFGPHPWLGELLNAALGVATAWLVHRLALMSFGSVAAAVALYLFAISPDQIFMTPILGSETLYALLITAAALALVIPGLRSAIAVGVALGASMYVRATTAFVAVAILVAAPLVLAWPRRLIVIALTAVVIMVPVVIRNQIDYGEWSLSTSRFGAWSLLIGTNQEHNGVYNTDDLRFVGGRPETIEGNRLAQDEAIRRITSDPVAFAGLVVRKFEILWGSGDYGIRAAGSAGARDPRNAFADLSQLIYVAIVLLATATAWRLRKNAVVLLTLAIVVVISVVHSFIEVTPRYHAYVIPLLCILAAPEAIRRWAPVQAASPTSA
jgi:4-amino-4-deoxy-L-arabinose transferase-like glycosyltransferase